MRSVRPQPRADGDLLFAAAAVKDAENLQEIPRGEDRSRLSGGQEVKRL